MIPLLTSGKGAFHTDEPGKDRRKPYLTIGWGGIKALVDNPQTVDKDDSQWLIPSTLLSRTFKQQETHGEYWLLWADLDKNPPPLERLGSIVDSILGGGNFELYNSRSATLQNQKARLLIPLDEPLNYEHWTFAQAILNDSFEALGITPDRSNVRAGQLCYLPNRGALYGSYSRRDGRVVNRTKHKALSNETESTAVVNMDDLI